MRQIPVTYFTCDETNVFGGNFCRCSWRSNGGLPRRMAAIPEASSSKSEETFLLGGDLLVNRLGFGAMRLTGEGT